MSSVNDILLDRLVSHQIGLYRLATQTVQELSLELGRYAPRIVQLLARVNGDSTPGEVEAILRSIRSANQRAYGAVLNSLTASMNDIALYEIKYQTDLLSSTFTRNVFDQVGLAHPTKIRLSSVVTNRPIDGAKLSEYIAGAAEGRFTRMRDVVRRAYAKGDKSVSGEIVALVVGTRSANYADGVFALGLRSLEQITRTIQSGVISSTRDLLYNENDHMFSGVLWVSGLDVKTSSVCQHYDGKIFRLGHGPRPPVHRVCRSMIIPVVRSWQQLGLGSEWRDKFTGKVARTMTYYQWLSRQPASVQDEVLGPTRGRLFRKGEVSITRFTDNKGQRYTLKELRKREGLSLV